MCLSVDFFGFILFGIYWLSGWLEILMAFLTFTSVKCPFFVLSGPQTSRICQIPPALQDKKDWSQSFKQPQEQLYHWMLCTILSLPKERQGSGVLCPFALCWAGWRAMAAASSNRHLCSHLLPDRRSMPDSFSALRQAREKSVLCAISRKAGAVDVWSNSSFLQGETGSWCFPSAYSVLICGEGYDNCQLKPSSLISMVWSWLGYSRSQEHSEISKTEASLLGSPQKSWVIRCLVRLFPFPGRGWDLGDFLLITQSCAGGRAYSETVSQISLLTSVSLVSCLPRLREPLNYFLDVSQRESVHISLLN